MTNKELYELIALPEGVREQLEQYENNRAGEIPTEIREKLFVREHWNEGLTELLDYFNTCFRKR